MGKQRNITPRVAQSYDDAFKAFNEVVKQGKGNTGFGSLGSEASSTFRGYNTGIGSSVYDKNLSWNANINEDDVQGSLNEFRANEQSALDHLGIGAVRTVAKAAVEIAKLPGVIGGIAMSPFAAENEGFETAFNNQWVKYFDSLNEDVKEALPVYIKESVANGDFFTKIGSSATWATEGADGAGYMLGMLAPGAIFKFAGGANALFGASIKAAKLAKYGKNIQAAGKFLERAGITVKNIDQYMIPAFNTISEAGAESKGVWDGIESRKGEAHEEYMSKLNPNDPRFQTAISLKNEQLDELRRAGEISIDEYNKQSANIHNVVAEEMFEKDFKEQKALAAQNTFFKNAVVLAGPNYIQAKLLFGKTPSKVLLDKIGGLTEKSIKNTIKQGVKNFTKGFASEGAEEIGQTAIQNRNNEQGLKFKLGDNREDDYNILTFGDDFIKTLGTTEGQMAGFLGGIMGAPMSAVGGYKQDIADRKQTERLRDKINGESTAYKDVVGTNIYEQEEYTNPETNEVSTRDKEVDGKKIFIPEAVAKVKNALDLTEKQGQIYDKAVAESDTETLEYLKGQAEFNLINKFIGEDEVTLDALHEYLKVAFPTQKSENVSEEQVKSNKENSQRVEKIMNKAKSLQKDLMSYKDMAASLIRINNSEVTEEHLSDFMNRVGSTFISERAEEFDAKDKLNKLEKQKADLLSNSTVIEIDNPNYIEGISSELDKTTKTRSNNPRLDLINSQIEKVKEQLKDFEEATNSTIWDNEYLNKKINNEVIAKEKLQKATSPEEVAKNNDVINKTKNATTVEEVKEIEKTSPKETIENPAIKEQIDNKKAELKKAKEVKESGIISNAKEDDEAFNGTSKTQTYSTEGSDISDELTPKTSENTTTEEDKEAKTIDPTQGKGVKLISYNRKDDEVFSWIKEQFPKGLAFERNPVDKIGTQVSFEINQTPGVQLAEEALTQFKAGNFQNIQLLIDYLPINIKLAEGAYLPIETRRVNGEINPETEMLRKSLITSLINGVPIENMNSTITGQYKGVLQVESPTAENSLLDLSGVDGLKYIKDNTYFVNIHGQLENVLTGQTRAFQNKFTKDLDRTKNYAAGEIYLMVPQADGVSQFPLKLNIGKLSIEESEGLFEIYKEILTQDKGSNTTLSEVSPKLLSVIENIFGEQLKIITTPSKIKDIKLGEIIDLLVHESDKPKSRINVTDGVLYFGENGTANSGNIDELKEKIINFLHTQKRHQIKIRPKTAEDNQRTNLSSNSANYIKYLVEGKILSTNAVVNEPLFQGYTNLFISSTVTIKGSETKKSTTIEDKKADIEKRRNKVLNELKESKEEVYAEESYDNDDKENFEYLEIAENINPIITDGVYSKESIEKITGSYQEVLDKINAKYDAELKTLEKSTTKVKEYTETEIEDRLKGVRTIKELAEGFKTLSKEQQDLYKPLFTEKRIQIEDKGKVKVSDAGAETDSKNWEGLDFGENKKIDNKTEIAEIEKRRQVELKKARLVLPKLDLSAEQFPSKYPKEFAENKKAISEWEKLPAKINAKYDAELATLENKSQNVRNVQENSVSLPESTTVIKDLSDSNKFVSSSDIPNTVENKQQVEKQNEVFEASKGKQKQFHLSDMKSLLNREESQLTDKQKQDLENYKKAYPDEYKKHCK